MKGAKRNFLVNKILSNVPFWNSLGIIFGIFPEILFGNLFGIFFFWNSFRNSFGNSFRLEFLCMSGFVGVQVLHGKEKLDLMTGGNKIDH